MMFKLKHLNKLVIGFIAVSLIFFVAIIYLIGLSQKWFEGRTLYYTYISDSSDVEIGTKIRISGFDIGYIKEMELSTFNNQIRVKVELYIYDTYKKYVVRDSYLMLYKPLLGSPFLQLIPGVLTDQILEEGDVIFVQQEQEVMMNILNLVGSIRDEIVPTIANVNKITEELYILAQSLNDPQGNLQLTLNEVRDTVENINKGDGAVSKILTDPMVASNIDEMIINFKSILESLNTTAHELNKIAADLPQYSNEISQLIVSTNRVMENVNVILESQNMDAYGEMSQQLGEITKNMNDLVVNIVGITSKLNQGEGTLGKIITEDTIHEEVVAILQETKGTIQETRGIIGQIVNVKTYLGLEIESNVTEEYQHSRLYLRIVPNPYKFYLAGARIMSGYDIPKDNGMIDFRGDNLTYDDYDSIRLSFDALLGWNLRNYPLSIYGGLLANNPGAGLTYHFSENVSLSATARTASKQELLPRDFTSNLHLDYNVWRTLNLYTGVNDPFGQNEFVLGMRFLYLDEDIKYLIGAMSLR